MGCGGPFPAVLFPAAVLEKCTKPQGDLLSWGCLSSGGSKLVFVFRGVPFPHTKFCLRLGPVCERKLSNTHPCRVVQAPLRLHCMGPKLVPTSERSVGNIVRTKHSPRKGGSSTRAASTYRQYKGHFQVRFDMSGCN